MKLKCNTCDGIFDTVDIRFTKKCDNNCSFCIEQFSSITGSKTDVDAIAKSVLETGTDEVLVLGGEPFLEIEKLLQLVKLLKEQDITVYITTSLPSKILRHGETFDEIVELIDGLNVSVHHFNSEINNSVYRNDSHNRIELLQSIVERHPYKVRACVNLVKGVLDNKTDIRKTLNLLYSIGVPKVKLNELCHSDEYVSYEKVMGVRLGSPYTTGCYTEVLKEEFLGMQIELKRSCFITEKTLSAGWMGLLKVFLNRYIVSPLNNKFCVVYEDGTVRNNWVTEIEK